MRYTHETWSIDLPDGWSIEEEEEHMVLSDSSAVGTFGITSFFKETGDVSFDDLVEFAEIDDLQKTDFPYLEGISNSAIEKGDAVFRWWFRAKDELIFVTYVCDEGAEDLQADIRKEIIMSLRSHNV